MRNKKIDHQDARKTDIDAKKTIQFAVKIDLKLRFQKKHVE